MTRSHSSSGSSSCSGSVDRRITDGCRRLPNRHAEVERRRRPGLGRFSTRRTTRARSPIAVLSLDRAQGPTRARQPTPATHLLRRPLSAALRGSLRSADPPVKLARPLVTLNRSALALGERVVRAANDGSTFAWVSDEYCAVKRGQERFDLD